MLNFTTVERSGGVTAKTAAKIAFLWHSQHINPDLSDFKWYTLFSLNGEV